MSEFFSNIYLWFVENKDAIIAFFTSGTTIGFITSIVLLVRQLRASKDNTTATNVLNDSIKSNNELTGSVGETNTNVKELKEENTLLKKKVDELESEHNDFKEAVFDKLNAMMEVQSLVYSTIKDDTIRENVQNLLINAKYCEVSKREDLRKQVETLKEQLAAKFEDAKNIVDAAVSEVKKTINVEDETDTEEVMRY